MKTILTGLLCAASLFGAAAAQAVMPGAGGQGQLLILPYYTANAGNTSLILLQNNDTRGKVVQLRVAEGDIGDTAAVFNIYLAAHDSWTGAIIAGGASGAVLTTSDSSCTMPALETTTAGLRFLPLAVRDRLPGSPGPQYRSREGWIEAIEVATIAAGTTTATALSAEDGHLRNCDVIRQAWTAPNGYWTSQPRADLRNPHGRLSGYSAVINVAAGTFFTLPALALDRFRADPDDSATNESASVVQHQVPTPQQLLTLADAVTDPDADFVRADLVAEGRPLRLTYPRTRAVDAVSAVLAADQISADFDVSPGLGATTTFLQVYPTRRFYTDPALLPANATAATAPFHYLYNEISEQPLELYRLRIVDREGATIVDSDGADFGGCNTAVRQKATAVALNVPFGVPPDPLLGSRFHGTMNRACGGDSGLPSRHVGTVLVRPGQGIYPSNPGGEMRPSREGFRVLGLPVVGLRLINYVNANVQQGVLANYSSATPLATRAACIDAAGRQCVQD